MSKHQTSRRRTYGRRQHELHERTDRAVGFLGWLGERADRSDDGWLPKQDDRSAMREWSNAWSAD